jgi:hypothetical protein
MCQQDGFVFNYQRFLFRDLKILAMKRAIFIKPVSSELLWRAGFITLSNRYIESETIHQRSQINSLNPAHEHVLLGLNCILINSLVII